MKLRDRIKGSSVKWYLLGIASAVAAGWIGGEPRRATETVSDSSASTAVPFTPRSEDIELVVSARALERAGDSVGARAGYLQAAATLSPISDYLRLRAAQLTVDSGERRKLYHEINSSPAREQMPQLEARILELLGLTEAAVRSRAELGQHAEVFRVRLAAATDAAARRPVLKDLVAWVADSSDSPLRSAVGAMALPFIAELSALEALGLARASAATGAWPAASAYFARASTGRARLRLADYAAWGEAQYSTGRYREAASTLRRVSSGPARPRSMLLRARALLRSGQAGGKAVLDDLVRRYPRDSTVVPTALFLLGDLARDASDLTTARRRWTALAERFPASEPAARARFLGALILYSQGKRQAAAAAWDSLFTSGMGKEEALAGGYWAGRAFFELGDTTRARARWEQLIAQSRLSYYSRLAYRRLGIADSTLAAGNDHVLLSSGLGQARERLNLLAATGLTPELGKELTWLSSRAGDDLSDVLGTASLLREYHRGALAAQLGWRALESGATNARTYRLIFPLLFADPLIAASRSAGVEPALTAALIRQESLFDTSATSRAGARGLMQVMPSVGQELARSGKRPAWHADSLYQPGYNLELGTTHLAWALERYGGLERTLAAYNAGGSRVTRWARIPGGGDPELFVEWIPFPETRTYVRTVLRNLEFYRGLYAWD